MRKVKFNDRFLIDAFFIKISLFSAFTTLALAFLEIPKEYKTTLGFVFLFTMLLIYLISWRRANDLKSVEVKIEGSTVCVKEGDIFKEFEFKVIAFNEYFDTKVDDDIISKTSLNGIYIKQIISNPSLLDDYIENYKFQQSDRLDFNSSRSAGKKQRYRLGTIIVHKDYLLTAFSKFDELNQANLTMPEYLSFLINFWDQINAVYARKSVSVPILGSGITRIKGHKGISDEDLLKIMIWTFRVSEMRFKKPAKLTIVIHPDNLKFINLLDIKYMKTGI